jgi:YfiH family protein
VLELGRLAAGTAAAGFCFTGRAEGAGGHSAGPYAGLNLSFDVGDEPDAVAANRERVLEELQSYGLSDAVWLQAEHAAAVTVVRGPDDALAGGRTDAFVSGRPGLGLAALAADCALVVLADPAAGVVGVLHCGRPGLVAGVVSAAVEALRSIGGQRLVAAVGPTICGECYELPVELADSIVSAVPAARARRGHVDIRAGVVGQLGELGVRVAQLVGGCTREDQALFSYRRDGTTGRQAALVWLEP